ncbi:hypothetical protein BWK58_14550 [Flavobacterium columnare]|nr:hypothetical protein BWK58_14550 [Flavobacterium columnare]
MKIKNLHKELYLEYDEKLISKIEQIALEHYPNEFGGFLIGYYSEDLKTLVLTDLLIPNEYKSYRTLFERGTKGISEKLIELFRLKEKRYYVGEWHSHPNASSRFSSTDLNAMKNIAKSESVRIENPILLIVSVSSQKLIEYTFYLFDNDKLLEYGKN